MSVYTDKILKYPLKRKELKLLDDVWNFLDIFRITFITRSEFRDYIINQIKMRFTLKQFYRYEKIVEKLYWNMCELLGTRIDIDNVFFKKYDIKNRNVVINNILKESNIGRTTIKKAYVINKNDNTIYYKYNYPDDFDLLMYSIMTNRILYETIIMNKNKITLEYLDKLIDQPFESIIEFDYPFPNINTFMPFCCSKDERKMNIFKMYYDDRENVENNWFLSKIDI